MKIAYQGIEGSFSHRTLSRFSCKTVGLPTFRAVYEAVEKDEVDLGLLPIENTLAGVIEETIDLLTQGDLQIVGELHTSEENYIRFFLISKANLSFTSLWTCQTHDYRPRT